MGDNPEGLRVPGAHIHMVDAMVGAMGDVITRGWRTLRCGPLIMRQWRYIQAGATVAHEAEALHSPGGEWHRIDAHLPPPGRLHNELFEPPACEGERGGEIDEGEE